MSKSVFNKAAEQRVRDLIEDLCFQNEQGWVPEDQFNEMKASLDLRMKQLRETQEKQS